MSRPSMPKRPLAASAALLLTLASAGCGKPPEEPPPPPPPPVIVQAPDYEPVGEGIKVHSYALVGVAVIIAVALVGTRGGKPTNPEDKP